MSDDIAPHFSGSDRPGSLTRGSLAMGLRQVGPGKLQVINQRLSLPVVMRHAGLKHEERLGNM